jgi:hypothetical protein
MANWLARKPVSRTATSPDSRLASHWNETIKVPYEVRHVTLVDVTNHRSMGQLEGNVPNLPETEVLDCSKARSQSGLHVNRIQKA